MYADTWCCLYLWKPSVHAFTHACRPLDFWSDITSVGRLHVQAVSIPNGVATLAAIANEMILLSGCGTLLPLIHSLYPAMYSTPESLGLDPAELQSVPSMDPLLAECALQGI